MSSKHDLHYSYLLETSKIKNDNNYSQLLTCSMSCVVYNELSHTLVS